MSEHQKIQQSGKPDSTFQKQAALTNQNSVSHPASIIQRARIDPKSLTAADVLQLQRTIGNRAVGRLLSEIRNTSKVQQVPIQRQTVPEEEKEPLQGMFGKESEEETCPSCVQRQEKTEEEEPLQGKFETIQRLEPEEEEKLQMKSVVQRQESPGEDEPIQGKMIRTIQRQEIPEEEPLQKKSENNTGMPDNLKAGVESLSGIDMSDVRVHYNSSKPAEVGALAYTQGTNIHVALGQEKHLPHESWHVVQQAQRRVKPTMQMKGLAVNDEVGLEQEADLMGGEAEQINEEVYQEYRPDNLPTLVTLLKQTNTNKEEPVQGYFEGELKDKILFEILNNLKKYYEIPLKFSVSDLSPLQKDKLTPYRSYKDIADYLKISRKIPEAETKEREKASGEVLGKKSELRSTPQSKIRSSLLNPKRQVETASMSCLPSTSKNPRPLPQTPKTQSSVKSSVSMSHPPVLHLPSTALSSQKFTLADIHLEPTQKETSFVPQPSLATTSKPDASSGQEAKEKKPMVETGRKKIRAPSNGVLVVYRGEKKERNTLDTRRSQGGLRRYKPSSRTAKEAFDKMVKSIEKVKDLGGIVSNEPNWDKRVALYTQSIRFTGQEDNLATALTAEGQFEGDFNYTIQIPGIKLFYWDNRKIGSLINPGEVITRDYLVLNADKIEDATIFGIGHNTGTMEVSFYTDIPGDMITEVRTEEGKKPFKIP